MVTFVITTDAATGLAELPRIIQQRISRLRLQAWPDVSGCKALSGDLAGHYRMRTGDYRLQFHAQRTSQLDSAQVDYRVVVTKIGHRDGFYED